MGGILKVTSVPRQDLPCEAVGTRATNRQWQTNYNRSRSLGPHYSMAH
jgi:hypothetical protein